MQRKSLKADLVGGKISTRKIFVKCLFGSISVYSLKVLLTRIDIYLAYKNSREGNIVAIT